MVYSASKAQSQLELSLAQLSPSLFSNFVNVFCIIVFLTIFFHFVVNVLVLSNVTSKPKYFKCSFTVVIQSDLLLYLCCVSNSWNIIEFVSCVVHSEKNWIFFALWSLSVGEREHPTLKKISLGTYFGAPNRFFRNIKSNSFLVMLNQASLLHRMLLTSKLFLKMMATVK